MGNFLTSMPSWREIESKCHSGIKISELTSTVEVPTWSGVHHSSLRSCPGEFFCATHSDSVALREIASFAEYLNVSYCVAATTGKWNYMVKAKLLPCAAFDTAASIALPYFTLHCPRNGFTTCGLLFDFWHACESTATGD